MFPYFVALAGVSVFSIIISAIIAYRNRERSIITGAIGVVGAAFWLMMDALQLTSSSLSVKLFFYMMRFAGLVFVPGGWFLLALLISGYERFVNRRNIIALCVVPFLTLLLDFTNQFHGLMWSGATLNPADPYLPIKIIFGPAFWVLVVSYSYALLMVGLVVLVRRVSVLRSSYRITGFQMLLVSAVPWTLNVAYVIDRDLFPYFEPSSLAISVAGVLLLWRLVYLPLANVVPVAHEKLVDSLDEGIIVLDALNRVVEANPKAQTLFGLALSQAGGKPVENMWNEWPAVGKALESEAGTGKEVSLGHGGEQRIYEVNGSKIEGPLANVPYQLVTLRDITERKRMESELKRYSEHLEELVSERTKKLAESERRFRELADLLPQPVFEVGNEGTFTFVNRAGFALTGYTEEDMRRGVNALDLVVPEDQERLAERMMKVLSGENIRGSEYTAVRKDGSTFPVFLHGARVMRNENEFAGFRAIAVDISERKRMEEALLRSQRMASIGETAAMVGHDLRNPLQAMTNTLYLVKRLAASEKVEDRKETVGLLGGLNDAIHYMDKIVSDLQDYARPVAAAPVETSLVDLVRATVSSVRIPRNVEVTMNVGDRLSNVKLDPALFRRVLTNLILNAVQAMPEGGKLAIAGSRGDESFTVAVQDTGLGIAPENLEKVFNPFFTTKAQGQGLGLAVCKRLMEAQGGAIEVASQVGKGSTFTLKMPTNGTNGTPGGPT